MDFLVSDILRPVSVGFLAKTLRKQAYQIERRLARCPVLEYRKINGKEQPFYDFWMAASYLIEPKGSIDEWMAQNNSASIPPYINKMFWDGAMQRMRVMREAGDLWHSEDVLEVLGQIAITVRERTQLWVEEIPERDLLTDAQFKGLLDLVGKLQNDIRDNIILVAKEMAQPPATARGFRGELLEQHKSDPVAVFYNFQFDRDSIRERFPHAVVANEDDDFMRKWNDKKIPLLLAHPASIGHGTNMQYGGHVGVWYGLTCNLEHYQQANLRLPRPSQTEQVVLYQILMEGTRDMDVVDILHEKGIDQGGLIAALRHRVISGMR